MNEFINGIRVSPEQVDRVLNVIEAEWNKREQALKQELETLDSHIQGLRTEIDMTGSKIKLVSNETAIKYIEEDIVRIEQQIKELEATKMQKINRKPINWQGLKARVRYLAEHFDELLLQQIDPVKKAQFFAALFNKFPTFEDLASGTPGKPNFTGVNPIFSLAKLPTTHLVIPRRIELLLPG